MTQPKVNTTPQWLALLQTAFGYTNEEITVIMRPMADEGKEPTASMGDDTALAVLSVKSRPLFHCPGETVLKDWTSLESVLKSRFIRRY